MADPTPERRACEACGIIDDGRRVHVLTTNGSLFLCEQCLGDINRKSPLLAAAGRPFGPYKYFWAGTPILPVSELAGKVYYGCQDCPIPTAAVREGDPAPTCRHCGKVMEVLSVMLLTQEQHDRMNLVGVTPGPIIVEGRDG